MSSIKNLSQGELALAVLGPIFMGAISWFLVSTIRSATSFFAKVFEAYLLLGYWIVAATLYIMIKRDQYDIFPLVIWVGLGLLLCISYIINRWYKDHRER